MNEEEVINEEDEFLLISKKILKRKAKKIDEKVGCILDEAKQLEISLDENKVREIVVLSDKIRYLKPSDKQGFTKLSIKNGELVEEFIPYDSKTKRKYKM